MESVQSTDEYNKRIKMFESLGIYYDSHYEKDAINPTKGTISGVYKAVCKDGYSEIKYECNKANFLYNKENGEAITTTIESKNTYYSRGIGNFTDEINDKVSNFVVQGDKSSWNGTIEFNGKTLNYKQLDKRDEKVGGSSLLQHILKNSSDIPRQFSFNLTVDVEKQTTERKKYFLDNVGSSLRGNYGYNKPSTVEAWFKAVIDANFEKTSYRYGRNRHFKFKGKMKQFMASHTNQNLTFLLDYLYGKNTAKNTKREDLQAILAAQGTNSFGIFDIRVLIEFIEIIGRKLAIQVIADRLYKLGVEPVTNKEKLIKRWKLKETTFNPQGV